MRTLKREPGTPDTVNFLKPPAKPTLVPVSIEYILYSSLFVATLISCLAIAEDVAEKEIVSVRVSVKFDCGNVYKTVKMLEKIFGVEQIKKIYY